MSVETIHLVRAAVAPVLAEPKASSEQVSQSVAGRLATVVEVRDGWRRVRLADGYEGWMHEGYLDARELSAREAGEWTKDALLSLGCTVKKSGMGMLLELPLGARMAPDTEVARGSAVNPNQARQHFPPNGFVTCTTAIHFFANTSYQWGGVTPWGADCSGMVQTVFGLHGIALPRDARQQAQLGSALELSPDAWTLGDLLFFSDREDGRITHVAIVAHDRTLMHVAIGRGGFAVEHLDDVSDPYTSALMGRLKLARRVIGS